MKNTSLILIALLFVFSSGLRAQDEESESKLSISGSVDTYYKYDLSGVDNISGGDEARTFFAKDHNSLSIGMVNVILEKQVGKASFVGDVAFGERGTPSGAPGLIQNLYVAYELTDKLTATAGYMGTFVGYEVISPTANFNYSTSYLFSWGPFQNAGVKLDYAVNDKFAVMAGLFNPWNVYTSDTGLVSFGAQVYVSPVDGWDAYLNFITGTDGTEFDLTTTFQVTDNLLLGLNAATYSDGGEGTAESTFTGGALYLNVGVSDAVALGARYEHFEASEASGILAGYDAAEGNIATTVDAVTLSANIGNGALTIIPEFRYDFANADIFLNKDGATGSASQFIIAGVFAF